MDRETASVNFVDSSPSRKSLGLLVIATMMALLIGACTEAAVKPKPTATVPPEDSATTPTAQPTPTAAGEPSQPTIGGIDPPHGAEIAAGSVVTISLSVEDEGDVASVDLISASIPGVALPAITPLASLDTPPFEFIYSLPQAGSAQFTFSLVDIEGNSREAVVTYSVVDTEAVLPRALISDPNTACPGRFKSEAPKPGRNYGFLSAGQDRAFFLTLPEDLPEGPAPLVFLFNGTGETGWGITLRTGLHRTAKGQFILVAPYSNGNGHIWPVWDSYTRPRSSPNPDLVFFDDLLQCLAAHFQIDANRIYATGHSAGGIFTHYLSQRRSNVLAAVAPASADFGGTTPRPFEGLEEMAVLVIWGGKSDYWSGSVVGASGTEFSVTRYEYDPQARHAIQFYQQYEGVVVGCNGEDTGHSWISRLNPFIWRFFEAHPKGFNVSPYTYNLPGDAPTMCFIP
ncbi:MAG: alpha/beta hydrolase family esterase [Dehalococcoidia bacterium]